MKQFQFPIVSCCWFSICYTRQREPLFTHGRLACFTRFADSILLFMLRVVHMQSLSRPKEGKNGSLCPFLYPIWCEYWDRDCVGSYVVNSTCFSHKIEKNGSLVLPSLFFPHGPWGWCWTVGFFFLIKKFSGEILQLGVQKKKGWRIQQMSFEEFFLKTSPYLKKKNLKVARFRQCIPVGRQN